MTTQTVSQRTTLKDFAQRNFLRPGGFRRMRIRALIAFKKWDIGNSDSALYKMHCERDHVNNDIAAEMLVRCKLVDDVRKLEQRL